MALRYWQNPHKPTMERIYVDERVWQGLGDLDTDSVKVWIEPSEKTFSGWAVKSKGDVSSVGSGPKFQSAVMASLGITKAQSWSDLVALAGSNPGNKRSAKARSGPGARGKPDATNIPKSARDAEALKLSVSSIKMPGPVTIQVDHREPASLINLLAEHPLITVERVALPLGDILVEDADGNRLIIERKRCDDTGKTDFEASVQVDGRLFDQSERLKMEVGASDKQVIPVFLLEGDVYGNSGSMLCQQIDGALSFLSVVQKVSVLPVYNQSHAAYAIAKLATHFVSGLYTAVSLHKAKPKAIFEQQKYVLESLPGVSAKVAETLLEHFGSVRNVMAASKQELLEVNGLGPKKVEALVKVIG